MKTLHLTLKKKWFDMIASGEKKEEYREKKDYWINRLCYFEECLKSNSYNHFKSFDSVTFKNGYAKNAPVIVLEFKGIELGSAKPEWSDNWQGDVFVIKLGKVTNPVQYESVTESV